MVYVLAENGFEETELIVPVDILRRGGVEVKIVGVSGEYVSSTRNITLKTDIKLDDLILYDMEMLVIPGGQPGVDNLWNDLRVRKLVEESAKADKFIGAICAAPMILGRLGLLQGKNATCYPGCEEDLAGANIKKDETVRDGMIITSRGAGCAFSFGAELLNALTDKENADKVVKSMQYNV